MGNGISYISFEVEFKQITFEVDLNVYETIGLLRVVKSYVCGESIIDGQVVRFDGEKIWRAKPTDDALDKIIGVALQSGQENEIIDVLLQGVYTPTIPLGLGILYLGENSFPSNLPPDQGAIVTIGCKMDGLQTIIFDNKEAIFKL